MESSNLKNIVVLNNLPSNIVDEAIIVLKANKKIENVPKIEQNKRNDKNINTKEKDYILKEAEMLVNNYVSKMESKSKRINDRVLREKYFKMRNYSIIITMIAIIEVLVIVF